MRLWCRMSIQLNINLLTGSDISIEEHRARLQRTISMFTNIQLLAQICMVFASKLAIDVVSFLIEQYQAVRRWRFTFFKGTLQLNRVLSEVKVCVICDIGNLTDIFIFELKRQFLR